MSERERWIVYPLLFLALGASLRDKFYERASPRIIECQQLRIVDEDDPANDRPNPVATLGLIPGTNDRPSTALLEINGSAIIKDQLVVQNVTIGPTLQAIVSTLQAILEPLMRGARPVPSRQGLLPPGELPTAPPTEKSPPERGN